MSCDTSIIPDFIPILFRLPRELRDLVYDFALKTKSPGINIGNNASTTPQLSTSSSLHHHVNQLQFVCKQLRVETSSISSGWKEHTFDSSDTKPAIENFHAFLKRCSSIQRTAIRRIIILQPKYQFLTHRTGTPYRLWFRTIYGASHAWLYNFCLEHPTSHIIVRYDFLNPLAFDDHQFIPSWVFEHATLRMTLRGAYGVSFSDVQIYDEGSDHLVSERELANMHLNNPLSERHMLTMEDGSWEVLGNLRMSVSRTFDEEALRNLKVQDYVDRGIDVDKRIEEMKNLFEEGC